MGAASLQPSTASTLLFWGWPAKTSISLETLHSFVPALLLSFFFDVDAVIIPIRLRRRRICSPQTTASLFQRAFVT